MKINYLGHSSFKISTKSLTGEEVTIIIDPFDPKMVGLPFPVQKADIVITSHQHPDHNFTAGIEGISGEDYFLIDTPGEYEVKGIRFECIQSFHDESDGKERGLNTITAIDAENIRIAHLGDLGAPLSKDQLESLDTVDILMIPVGGFYTIGAKEAIEIIESIEPSVVIPMHYKMPNAPEQFKNLATLEDFIKEFGAEAETKKEYKINSRSDLPQNITVVPLEVNKT
ncbi:hypothetical protein A2982_02745 [candidate division WWE3 bacterium RIFCSPLOWO2_01_FULL_39_13]|uniref:Lactamase n=1 Tax=candidate division WWE3 bacterium RIFCSPLOWO2_01_FULL_39_13 TaxID=1802624 RepID=A0A1F4V316_UNCKA|nr:MAG: hypothetical protein A2982_02745 [candidate division WWE3 bacterium RIFCSPLOWO2_01_FULL_39_13]